MDVGARLKEARLAQELSLDSLEETTKIQKRYLVAIEEGNFHILPGKFYARAFIKEYANAVGIDPNELLEEHKEEIPRSEEESEIPYTRMERSRRENSDRNGAAFSIMPKIAVVLLVIGILVAAIWFYTQSRSANEPAEIEETENNVIITNPNGNNVQNPAKEDTEEAAEEPVEEDEEEIEEEPEMEFEVVEIGTGTTPESTIELTNSDEELIITLESETSVWLDVRNNEGEVFYNTFVDTTNSPVELDLTGEESIYLNIGSTPNLDIKINGVDFEYPVDPSERDHQRLWINVN